MGIGTGHQLNLEIDNGRIHCAENDEVSSSNGLFPTLASMKKQGILCGNLFFHATFFTHVTENFVAKHAYIIVMLPLSGSSGEALVRCEKAI